MKLYNKNKNILKNNHSYDSTMEHDACGVGLIASLNGEKSRKVVEYGIEALKAVWHRGAVDADGKSGDGAGISFEIPKDFFLEKIQDTEIVLGVRKLREEKLYLRLFRQAFYRINNLFTDSKTPIGAGEFMLITKKQYKF